MLARNSDCNVPFKVQLVAEIPAELTAWEISEQIEYSLDSSEIKLTVWSRIVENQKLYQSYLESKIIAPNNIEYKICKNLLEIILIAYRQC